MGDKLINAISSFPISSNKLLGQNKQHMCRQNTAIVGVAKNGGHITKQLSSQIRACK